MYPYPSRAFSPRVSSVQRPQPNALRVLVVDDSVVVRCHLVEMLGEIKEVNVVAEAEDTPSAVSKAKEHHPEVVVLDLQMPGENGLVALQRLKALLPDTKVIVLTNHANAFYREKCMEKGASYFFDKSSEFEKVADTVRMMAPGGQA